MGNTQVTDKYPMTNKTYSTMKQNIIITLAVLCSLQASAGVQAQQGDTVRYCEHSLSNGQIETIEPSYLDGVLVTSTWNGNWFVGLSGGASAFLGSPLGCADLFDRLKPTLAISVGKWFTPSIGGRLVYQGFQFKDCELASQDYQFFHADFLWNVLGSRCYRQVPGAQLPRWGIIPFVGVGLLHNKSNGQKPFAIAYGVQGLYRISNRLAINLELSNATTFRDFDGYGKSGRLGDNMLSLSAGLTVTIGKVGWKRAVDATLYIRQSKWLTEYTNTLLENNRNLTKQHDTDARALAELKKILEIEGLLDKYGEYLISEDDTVKVRNRYPKNDYSGLNSLRARMRQKSMSGELTEGAEALSNNDADNRLFAGSHGNGRLDDQYNNSRQCDADTTVVSASSPADYLAYLQSNNECIGSPVYFFFELGTTDLTDASQLINLYELARVAKKYGLSIAVTGAADSNTGTPAINDTLSASRADFIADELQKRGIPPECITKHTAGGINTYSPSEANRHTRVELRF